MITIICALADNNAIGLNNQLLYHLSADLKRFKALTTGHTIIMGRRTYESLPKGALPNRRNIVLTSQAKSGENTKAEWPGVEVFPSLEEALKHCTKEEEIFIIGGASLYKTAFPIADRLYLTHIHATPEEADVFFPNFSQTEWDCTFSERHEADEQNEQPFTFADYVRK